MDNQPAFNRDLFIPIFIGGFSIVGILVVLLVGRSLNSPAEVPMTPSPTPFQFVFLGTEPAITTPLVEESGLPLTDEPIDVPTEEPSVATQIISTASTSNGGVSIATPLILVTNTSSGLVSRTNTPGPLFSSTLTSTPNRLPTSTTGSGTAATSNTYDDTDSRLTYSGAWVSQSNVNGAHQGTLHVSNTIGDSVTFTFTSQELHVFYQAGPSLGAVTITIDGLGGPPLNLAQSETQIKEWISNPLSRGTHTVVIQHFAGGSVNLDSLVVPAAATGTPATGTATATATPTQ